MLSGRLLVHGDDKPTEAVPGSLFVAPRGHRHGLSNPSAERVLVLGIWAPAEPALAFMRKIMRGISAPIDPPGRPGVALRGWRGG